MSDDLCFHRLKARWSEPSGYREVLKLAGPLILSTSTWTLQHFVDRMFLMWYSPNAMAAAMPAGIFSFSIIAFFLGTSTYANTFVAQYIGAKRSERVGASVWQAIYFSLIAGCFFILIRPFAVNIFYWAGHDPAIRGLEIAYFKIMLLGGVFTVYCGSVSSFFSGRGKTWVILWVSLTSTAVNLILDYLLIFGHFGFPQLGITGAAIATVISEFVRAIIFSVIFLLPGNRRVFRTLKGWRFDLKLFKRLMKYGIPNGIQFMLDMFAFTLFIFFVGRLGIKELAATNIAFQINHLAFMPMIGFGIATSILVGQRLGANRPDLAARATWSAFHMTILYMTTIAALFVIFPSIFIAPFAANTDPVAFLEIRPLIVKMLLFVAFYSVFDTMNIIFASALKGAGDTRFVMFVSISLAWGVMALPTWIVIGFNFGGIYVSWIFITAFISLLGFVFLWRFLQGKWKNMRVIERAPARSIPLPEKPTTEVDI